MCASYSVQEGLREETTWLEGVQWIGRVEVELHIRKDGSCLSVLEDPPLARAIKPQRSRRTLAYLFCSTSPWKRNHSCYSVLLYIYFYLLSTVLIVHHFLICYFICPSEFRKDHQTSSYCCFPGCGVRIIDLEFVMPELCSLSHFSFALMGLPVSPTLTSAKIFHLEDFCPGLSRMGSIPTLLKLCQKY